jgi:hypothetical protein
VARRSSASLAGAELEGPSLSSAAGRFVRENSLSLFFLALFLVSLAGQSVAGHLAYNAEQAAHGADGISWARYLVSSHFGSAMLENWQSEFLQFTFFILATVWLVQRGSPESKRLDQAGTETKKDQQLGYAATAQSPLWARVGGWRTTVYANSLAIAMTSIFLASWAVQSLTGWNEYNADQVEHGDPRVSWTSYLALPAFWESTLQNWQSEFLAVGTMVVFAVYLRQRGSPESKPVGAPHDETGTTG